MITYSYWLLIIVFSALSIFLFSKFGKQKLGIVIAILLMIIGWGAYSFHFEQMFVKRFGGTMNISVPEGQFHFNATWKDDNLWINNFDPKTNNCYFREISRGNMLEGQVIIKNCSPLAAQQ